MPLLRDQAHEMPTIKHVMDKVKKTTSFLNPTQTTVITTDQPLFALAKQIQWDWPDEYGNFVIMMGALHIEMAALRMVGRILKGSGWMTAIEESGLSSAGTAESFLSVDNVTKTRRAHQVTVCSLYSLMKAANEKKELPPNVGLAELRGTDTIFQEWCNSKSENPQFKYWEMVLTTKPKILAFIRSLREGNFEAYKEAITALLPHFLSNDNTHYSRWLTVHLIDMLVLEKKFQMSTSNSKRATLLFIRQSEYYLELL